MPIVSSKLEHLLVTAATNDYIWGLLLLLGSLRQNNTTLPVLVLSIDLHPDQIKHLTAIDNIFITDAQTNRVLWNGLDCKIENLSPQTTTAAVKSPLFKVIALEQAFTISRTATWIDADCIVAGDITEKLQESFSGIRIRIRGQKENREVFLGRGQINGTDSIPSAILQQWQKDVCGSPRSRVSTQVMTNCFSLHDTNLRFVIEWGELMYKVGIAHQHGVVHKQNPHYFMTDESTMTALLAFGKDAPNIAKYNLDDTSAAHIIHFGEHPKPWNAWQYQHLSSYYSRIQTTVKWLEKQNHIPGKIPAALDPRYKPLFYLQSGSLQLARRSRRSLRKLWANL